MTCMRARTSLNFSLIGPPTADFFSAVLDQTLFILAGNDNLHESLYEFEIWLDPTTGFHGNI